MRDFNLLYGFNAEQTADKLSRALRALGYKANAFMRPSKPLIKDYLLKQNDLDAVVLKENLDGGDVFSIDEFVEMADNINVNFVILINSRHRGKDDMKKLYAAGILNVYFLDGKAGADPLKLAELLTRGRVRKEAREYYHIDNELLDRSLLTYAEYSDNYRYLLDQSVGLNIVDRFVTISRWLTPSQMAKFINMLPDRVMEVLRKYEEYYVIQTSLFRARVMPNKERKPKDVREALPEEYMIQLLSEGTPTVRIKPDIIHEPVAVRTDSRIDYTEMYGRSEDRSLSHSDRQEKDYAGQQFRDEQRPYDRNQRYDDGLSEDEDISYPEPEQPDKDMQQAAAHNHKFRPYKPQRADRNEGSGAGARDRANAYEDEPNAKDMDNMRNLSTEDLIEMYS